MSSNRFLSLLLILSTALFVIGGHAAPTPFAACPDHFFLSQGSGNKIRVSQSEQTASGDISFNQFSIHSGIDFNGMAFHEPSRFLYAIAVNQSPGLRNVHLIKIGQNGEYLDLGEINPGGTDLSDHFYLAADMNPAGEFFLRSSANRQEIVKLQFNSGPDNPSDVTISKFSLSKPLHGGDIAWSNGYLWALFKNGERFELARVDLSQDPANNVTVIGDLGNQYSFGAIWGAPDAVYANANGGQGFFHFNTQTGVATKIGNSVGASRNDAAHCNSRTPRFDVNLSISGDNGQDQYTAEQRVSYNIVVNNAGPFGVSLARVMTELPNNASAAQWQCQAGTGAGRCSQDNGNGAIDTTIKLPKDSSIEFNYSFTLEPEFSGELSNTASVSVAPLGSSDEPQARDIDVSDNMATDTDSPSPRRIPGGRSMPPKPIPFAVSSLPAPALYLTSLLFILIVRLQKKRSVKH